MVKPNTLEHHILTILYRNSKVSKKPSRLDLPRLAANLQTTTPAVQQAIKRLVHKGHIIRADKYGRKRSRPHSIPKRLVALLLEAGGSHQWDRSGRIRIAKQLGIKLSSLRRSTLDIRHLLHIEYDANSNNPIQVFLLDPADAEAYVEDRDLQRHSDGHTTLYRYVSGYSKPRTRKITQKPTRRLLKHRILLHLVNSGGTVMAPMSRLVRTMGCQRRSYERALNQLIKLGYIHRTPNGLHLRDAQSAANFLAQIGIRPTTAITTSNPSPLEPPAVAVSNGSDRYMSRQYQYSTATVVDVDGTTDGTEASETSKAVTGMILQLLLVRERLTAELYRMLVQYPSNYQKGQRRIMDTRKQIAEVDEEQLAALRFQRGVVYGKQKKQMYPLLECIKEHLGLSGLIATELVNEAIRRYQWALPEIEIPERDYASQLTAYCETVLPVDCEYRDVVVLFNQFAGVVDIAEFVMRGGIDFLFKGMEWYVAERGCVEHRVGWQIYSYLAYCEAHPYRCEYQDQWQGIINWHGFGTDESYLNGLWIHSALTRYLDKHGKLGSIYHLKDMICKSLCTQYPIKDGFGNWDMKALWAIEEFHEDLVEFEEYDVLKQWVAEWQDKQQQKSVRHDTIVPYSLKWHEAKLASCKDYGLPGDVEIIREKVHAMKEWTTASVERQRDHLVPVLNRWSRYGSASLDWRRWDELIRTGSIQQTDTE